MKNKILKLTVAMAAVILLTAALVVAVAAEVYSGKCGLWGNWTLDTSTGSLAIDGTGDILWDYTYESRAPWDPYHASITNVIIKDGITTIADYAFYGCQESNFKSSGYAWHERPWPAA